MPQSPRPQKRGGLTLFEDGLSTHHRLREWAVAAELLYAPNAPLAAPLSPNDPHALCVARRIATTMARLNALCAREASALVTPREALGALAAAVRFALVSFHADAFAEDGMADTAARFVARRHVPWAGVLEGLHAATWVSVKLRVELVMEQLRQRVAREMAIGGAPQRMGALRATHTLLGDLEAFYESALVTFPCVQLMDTSERVAPTLLPVLAKQYYTLLEWAAEVDGSTALPPITDTRVQSIHVDSASFVLRRTDPASPWGLLFNACGHLVDIDVGIRSASAEGEELHRLLRCAQSGVVVVAVNSTDVSPPKQTEQTEQTEQITSASAVLEALAHAGKGVRRLVVHLAKDSFRLPQVRQLAFFVPNQGGEGSSGQSATLVLHRADHRLPWECHIDGSLTLVSVPHAALEEEARAFFAEYPRRVRLMSVNGVEVTSPTQAMALAAEALTLVLNCVVTTPPIDTDESHTAAKRTHPRHTSRKRHTGTNEMDAWGKKEGEENTAEEVFPDATHPLPSLTTAWPELRAEALAAARETPLIDERQRTHPMSHLHAEDVDAEADAAFAADANEAEELTAESTTAPAEEEDVKETYLLDADNDTAVEAQRSEEMDITTAEEMAEVGEVVAEVRQKKRNTKKIKAATEEAEAEEVDVVEEGAVQPLVLPNDVTIELLTPSEMIIRRVSKDRKWDLSVEAVKTGNEENVRIKALPQLSSKSDPRRKHQFYQVFENPPSSTEWRIKSVNGTPSTRMADVVDVMRRSLSMRIKFFRR